jgi:hypothetical protein
MRDPADDETKDGKRWAGDRRPQPDGTQFFAQRQQQTE